MSVERETKGFFDDAINIALDKRTLVGGLVMIFVFTISYILIILVLNNQNLASNPQVERLLNELNSQRSGLQNLSLNPLILFAYIFARNTLVSIIIYLFSITIIIPLSIMSFNGMLVGIVVHFIFTTPQIHLAEIQAHITHTDIILLSYASLAPHGMLEIPSISLVAATIAWFFKPLKGKNPLSSALKAGSRLLTLTILNLLVSALVEAFITLAIAGGLLVLLIAS